MKKLLFNFLFVLLTFYSTAQTVDTSITSTYSKSVINRVYDVASKITLSITEQQLLADLFKDEEDDINAAVISNATPSVIDSIKLNYKSAFNQLLTTQQINDYYNISNAAKIKTTSRLMAAMLQHKYNATATMQQYFNQIYTWREEVIERIWCKNVDTPIRNNNLYNTMVVYDSLLSIYTNAANGSSYITQRINYLDSINPLDTTREKQLYREFHNNCINYKNRAYADNFKAAMNTVFNNIVDSPYYTALYKYDISSTANAAALTYLTAYMQRDKVSINVAQQILPLLQQRERIVAIVNKMYPSYTPEKQTLIDNLVSTYQTQIDNLIANSGSLNIGSQIDIALHYASQLQLNTEQIQALQTKLSELNELKATFRATNEFAEYDSKAFESEILTGILSTEQYTQVLTTKYYSTAANMAKQDWAALVNSQLTEGLTEADTKTELTNYHLAIILAYYRYAHNLETQFTTLASIRELKPEALNTLLNHWTYRNPYNDTPDTFFQW